jgi:hypothetical protein
MGHAEKGVAIVVHKRVVRSVVKKIVYNDRIIAIKLQAEPINIACQYRSMKMMKLLSGMA